MAKKAEKLCKDARMAFEKWRTYWQANINQYHEYTDFVLGKQWTEDEEDMLTTYKKVPLQFNKLATLINSLIGEQQQNTPQLQVVPLSNCSEATAKIYEIILKDIMFSGNSKTAVQICVQQGLIGGFSAYCIGTHYANMRSFVQSIGYEYFKDPTKCYWDPSAEHINKIDGMYAGYLIRMSRTKIRQIYGEKIEKNILSDSSIAPTTEEIALAVQPGFQGDEFNWADDDSIVLQRHFVRKFTTDTLYKLSNGDAIYQEELDALIESSREYGNRLQEFMPAQDRIQSIDTGNSEPYIEGNNAPPEDAELDLDRITLYLNGQPVRIEEKRNIKRGVIKDYLIGGQYILEESEATSEELPLIFFAPSTWYNKEGRQVCRPFLIDAKDAQRYINYLGTQSAYILKISRWDQWIGSKKNVASLDTQRNWRDPLSVQGMLTYDESPSGDKPSQVVAPELSQSLLTQYQRAIEDLYTSTGLYPTRMGQQGNEISGAAIDARTEQGSYTTYPVFSAINQAIAAGGVIVNQMIPKVYDSERVMALSMPDDGMQNVTINKPMDEYGMQIQHDIASGHFEVRLLPGPSYEGQKKQALNSLQAILQANPQAFNLIADLYVENLPLSNTIELKNRFKSIVPPQIIEAGKSGKSMPQGNQQPDTAAMEAQIKMKELELKEKDLQLKEMDIRLKAQKLSQDQEAQLAELETERLVVAAQLEEQKLRYIAEAGRTASNTQIAHADNIMKILTHKVA